MTAMLLLVVRGRRSSGLVTSISVGGYERWSINQVSVTPANVADHQTLPGDKLTGYYIITIVVAIVVYFVISMVVSTVVLGPYLATEAFRGM